MQNLRVDHDRLKPVCDRLVYYETYQDVQIGIAREKQPKRWRREEKIALIKKSP